MELAIINGTYRDGSKLQQKINQILIPNANPYATAASLAAAVAQNQAAANIRSPPNQLGQPLIISPRLTSLQNNAAANAANASQFNTAAALNGATFFNGTQLITTTPGDANSAAAAAAAGLYYTTIPNLQTSAFYPTSTDASFSTLEYPNGLELSQAGNFKFLFQSFKLTVLYYKF